MLLGVLGMLAVVDATGDDVSAWALAGPELLAGIGMGAMLAPLFDFVLAGVDDDEVGSASGVLNAMQQLGGAIGIAVIGTVFFSVAADHGITTRSSRCSTSRPASWSWRWASSSCCPCARAKRAIARA